VAPAQEKTMSSTTVSILEGNTFVISDRRGDIDAVPSDPHGLFHRDTRHLSMWKLTIDGMPLSALSTDDLQYFSAQFFLIPGTGAAYTDATLSVIRQRAVGYGFHEDIKLMNYGTQPLALQLRLEAAADFADLFEVRNPHAKLGEYYRRVEGGRLVLGYQRHGFVRETWISASAPEARVDEKGLTFVVQLGPQSEWTTGVDVVTARDGTLQTYTAPKYERSDAEARPNMEVSLKEWLDSAPRLTTDWDPLEQIYRRSLVDLAALRFYPHVLPGRAIPAAGLPWFMTVFGRDSLITSFQALPFVPELAETTLRMLAILQARKVDPFRDAEPGKIAHELRYGEKTAFEDTPHSPYYGTADATPLFLILLDEYERWTGDGELVQNLEPEARAALAWIDQYGDRDGDGYLEYQRSGETGLENQCWKDSGNSILFADGAMSSLPRAVCEIQGYVYDAKLRCARLAREFWGDPGLAEQLEREAGELKRRFNQDFWIADRGYFALALDGDKRQVDSLTSNNGHLLWSGIVETDKIASVVHHLMGPRLFSGWGVRTMAVGDGGYNPIGYHNGTVWPHDNALIALGLMRQGYRREAAQIAFGLLEAAIYFNHRLPEAFAGYPRAETRFPVEYPTACSPQAWATGAPLLCLRALLALQPEQSGVRSDPLLPEEIRQLELTGFRQRRERSAPRPPVAAPTAGSAASQPEAAENPLPARSARDLFDQFALRVHGSTALPPMACRFDITGVGSWRITVERGRVAVEESRESADLALELSEALLLDIASDKKNLLTAFMRGDVVVHGDIAYVPALQRLLRSRSASAERQLGK
jgi:glycogen debranching enzyme